METCISRELRKFAGLKSYFLSENHPDARFKWLKTAYEDPMTEAYLLFFQATLPCFTNFNKLLQREERFLHKLASKFIKPTVIQKHKAEGLSFVHLDISPENQKDDVDLGLGLLPDPLSGSCSVKEMWGRRK